MRIAVLSDIHGNIEALESCLHALSRQADSYLCLGDVVGYGPDPNACCETLRRLECRTVLGNHDKAAVGRADLAWFNPWAAAAIIWTQTALSPENTRWLGELPEVIEEAEFTAVHGSLANHTEEYITDEWSCRPTFDLMTGDLCFVGHTHVPCVFMRRRGQLNVYGRQLSAGGTIHLENTMRYVVNPGAVGQPRDGVRMASCALFDTETRTVEILRVEYPLHITQEKMRREGLPDMLWRRLEVGR
ncbi:MAG: metallophosphoesterase family protein [Armatimonadota bacterium]